MPQWLISDCWHRASMDRAASSTHGDADQPLSGQSLKSLASVGALGALVWNNQHREEALQVETRMYRSYAAQAQGHRDRAARFRRYADEASIPSNREMYLRIVEAEDALAEIAERFVKLIPEPGKGALDQVDGGKNSLQLPQDAMG